MHTLRLRAAFFGTAFASHPGMTVALQPLDQAFDPNVRGTDEERWRRILRAVPPWRPGHEGPERCLVVAPHPDDETLGAGGLLARFAQRWSARVLFVTDGEAARVDVPDLGPIRCRERELALTELGLEGGSCALGLPDGSVEAHEGQVQLAIEERADAETLIVAPLLGDGHPDHDAVARAAGAAAERLGAPIIHYPIWAWHHRRPLDLAPLRLRKLELTTRERAAKTRAFDRYRSQLRGNPPVVPPHVLRYFRRPFEVFAG